MARIKMHIPKAKLPFYPPCEVKCRLQNGVSTDSCPRVVLNVELAKFNCLLDHPSYSLRLVYRLPYGLVRHHQDKVCLEVGAQLV